MPDQDRKKTAPIIATVVHVESIGTSFRRITLRSDSFRSISESCVGGHLKLLFRKSGSLDYAELARADSDWRSQCVARTYTMRSVRAEQREIDIEFALHPLTSGPGAAWARGAVTGDEILLTRPSERKLNRLNAQWYLIVCDSCSLPAACAAIHSLPSEARGVVIINSDDEHDASRVASMREGFKAHHIRRDLSLPPSVVAARHIGGLRSLDIPYGDVECFVVGESRVVKEVKRYVHHGLQIDTDGMYFSAYWKQDHTQDEHKQAKRAERDRPEPSSEFSDQNLVIPGA
jgi:NADPH-dependent ferric siderophore reductase